jgi:hypothetical protein
MKYQYENIINIKYFYVFFKIAGRLFIVKYSPIDIYESTYQLLLKK